MVMLTQRIDKLTLNSIKVHYYMYVWFQRYADSKLDLA